jgi:N-acetylmuramoyl-L-alanine amidase
MKRDLKDIRRIIIHCSESKFGNSNIIDQWHKQNGWAGIGYHHVILNGVLESGLAYNPALDGTLQDGRSLATVGAHCKGHNEDSIGICLIGVDAFTAAQMTRLTWLVGLYAARFNIPPENILGHCELDPHKTCPNFDVAIVRDIISQSQKEVPHV